MTGQTDSDIPETGAIFTFGRSSFADNLPSKFWLKNGYPAGVCCGREHSAVITGNGKLLVFGCNSSGQLGLSLKPDVNKPASLKAFKSEKVTFVACGTDHTIVCTSNDRVYYAGKNQKARPGRGHSPKAGSFLRLHPFCERAHVKMLSAGCSTSAALTEDGRLFMWGDNSAGQIGLGDELFAAEPREVGVGEAVKWVSCGNRHSALVTVAGHLYTFGEHANGRLGLQAEQLKNHRAPQRVPGIPGHVTQVCCGGQHTVVLTGEDVFTFGGGRYGQLGHGTFLFEAPSPKPLQHFHKCSVRQIACGENHTAVITNGGLLYTFGDGRHGKLGLMEENFVNQFSPTLCTQFLKFNVQSVSCGGHHMLVLAAPRPARAREVLEKENFLLSSCAELPLKEQLIDLAPVFPLSALAARARHREKKFSQEMLGETLHKLPRLDSDLLNSSWKMSRNIQTLKDIFNPTSSPMVKSGESPLPSPRSQSVSLLSPALSSKPSSSRSLSSSRSKASACLTPKSAKLPSPLLSPKSIKCTPKKAVPSEKRAQTKAKKAEKSLSDKLLSPKEPSSPAGPTLQAFNENISEKEDSTQTEGDALHSPGVTQDEQEGGGDFSPNTVEKKDKSHRGASTEKQVFCFGESQDPYGQTDSTADPLSSSIKKYKIRTRKDRSLSNQENIPKNTIKTRKRPSSSGTAKRRELNGDPGVQKAGTEGKNDVKADKEGVKEKTLRKEVNTSALTDKTSDNAVKADVKVRQEKRVKLTPAEKKHGVKATPVKSHSTKLEPEKPAPCGTQRAKVQTKEATPAKGKAQSQEPKAKPDNKISIKRVNKGAREIKVESANKQNGKDEESEAKPRLSTKSGEGKSPGSKDKKQKKTKASSLLSSHHDGSSTQSPQIAEVLSVSGDKSPQSPHPAGAESLPTEGDRKEARITKEEKSGWEGSLRDAASLLPTVGMAGAAAGLLSEVLTSVVSFHSDSDKDTPSLPRTLLRQFTKQQEVQSIPSTPTHVASKEMEESTTEDAPVSSLKGDEEDDEGGTKSLRSDDDNGKTTEEKEKSSETDDEKERQTESFVEHREGGERRSSTEAEGESELPKDEEEQSMENEEDKGKEKSSSHADEEDDGSDAAEEEEEDGGMDLGKGKSEEEEAKESSDEGREEEEEEEEEAGSDVSDEEKESSASKSEEEEEEEEGYTAGSVEGEEESDSNEEEEDSEEQKGDDDSSESEVDEEKSAEEDDEEEDGSNEEEEAEETSDPENEEEEASVDDEATDDKEEEEEQDGDATSEEEQEEEGTTDNEEEADEDDDENEEEEDAATEEDEEEEEDSQEDDGETKQTESDEDTDEEEDGENDKEEKSDEEGMESEEEEEGEGEEDEEEAEEDEDDEEDDESVEEEEEEVGNEEEEAEEAEYEEEEEEEEVGNEEEEVNEDEEEEGENEEEEGEEVGNEEEEEGEQENEEEEGVEVEEEVEEEEEEEEVAQTGKDEAQKAPSLDKKPKREEAPTPAPRTKQTAVKKKQEDPQQFWNDVLPQYLDIQ